MGYRKFGKRLRRHMDSRILKNIMVLILISLSMPQACIHGLTEELINEKTLQPYFWVIPWC